MTVMIQRDLRSFFKDAVRNAISAQGASPSETAEFYVVSLLADSASNVQMKDGETLAESWWATAGMNVSEREAALRRLGDTALFVSGFYTESLVRKTVTPEYFAKMGSAAYFRLAEEIEPSPLFGLFQELGRDFRTFVGILGEVSESDATRNMRGLLALYEKWVWTKSASAYKRLVAEGIMPCSVDGGVMQ